MSYELTSASWEGSKLIKYIVYKQLVVMINIPQLIVAYLFVPLKLEKCFKHNT